MIYSCFDQTSGLYRYFEDGAQVPINGDLPVPSWLKGRVANGIGVPTSEAGRPLPSSAKPAGSGPQARGLVVRCDGGGAALGALSMDDRRKAVAFAAAALSGYFAYSKQTVPAIALGAIAFGAFVT